MRLVTIPDCDCAAVDLYPFPFKVDRCLDERTAALAYVRHLQDGDVYWSVHFKGAHLLAVLP